MRMNADGQGFVVATQYTAEAGGTANKRIDRKSCALALPVRVASGYQVALVTTLSGFVSSEVGTTVRVDHEQFYAGAKGVKLAKVYSDAKQRFLLSTSSSPAKLTWSQCGDDTNLRLNTSVTAQSNQAMDLAVGGIGDMRFRVVSRKCQ